MELLPESRFSVTSKPTLMLTALLPHREPGKETILCR